MNNILRNILDKKEVENAKGQKFPLHSHTDEQQGLLLQKIIKDVKPRVSLEIGLAYGISSLFILEELKQIPQSKHIIIEPFPDVYWEDIGLYNIRNAGFIDMVEFYKDFSFNVLPKLYLQGQKIQFAYLDTTKVFDIVLTDTFFISKMLDIGGVFVLDDVGFPGIRKIARFYSQHPAYEIVLQYKPDKETLKKRLYRKLAKGLIHLLPYKNKIMNDVYLGNDEDLGINYHAVGFRKIKEDDRNWDWSAVF